MQRNRGFNTVKIMTEYGTVTLDADVIASIAGAAATNCFGVKGMTHTSVKDGIVYLLKREAMTQGVKVTEKEDKIDLELHIAVDHGINIGAVCKSIISAHGGDIGVKDNHPKGTVFYFTLKAAEVNTDE